ncbi:MAG: BREX-3 system P-loop-containing protein BrxF [Candidatus Lokiarchaeota archaeon]|nr:BREX-3 system P-loop-containing protein BrxF [Candidatus Lokiarchaeota archaeon]
MNYNHISEYLSQADSLRFKLLGIIGKDPHKKEKIIKHLIDEEWHLVDVEKELLELRSELDSDDDQQLISIGSKIKEWFHSKPNNLILTNASILYHEMFTKISPIGAFKYNSRNKNCVIFLEDETQLGSRIYHSEVGKADYYDQEINDILLVKVDEIADDFSKPIKVRKIITDPAQLKANAIGHLFNFKEIKDVIDIDSDLKEVNSQEEIVRSYIISDSLENQIIEFFINLEKPNHKAIKVIGNYGSGKSHLIAFLISLVNNLELVDVVKNEAIRSAVRKIDRKFLTVQFELMPGAIELQTWFFREIAKQLKFKYNLDIPQFNFRKDINPKENIHAILEIIKKQDPSIGLFVVIDEISDFLTQKQPDLMNRDIQFLRIIGQVCQSEDLMFIGSMQEDVFTSPKFKNIAAGFARVEERFLNIFIHKEDIKKVISQRIVPKTAEQYHDLEKKLKDFAEKIDDVSKNIDEYINLFPLTPFLLELFSDLPYFEKRGVIQFAIKEIKYILDEEFPYFITFDKIYDELESNPNKRNIEEIYHYIKAMNVIKQKIHGLPGSFQENALRIVKALAVYAIWNKHDIGASPEELVKNLLIIPQNGPLTATDNISLIIKKIREATEGDYIKHIKDEISGNDYFKFDLHVGVDPEEKINQRKASVSDADVEYELFHQIANILELENYKGIPDIFEDECEWKTVKSFRKGYMIFAKKESGFGNIPERDYAIILVSPFAKMPKTKFGKNQLSIEVSLNQPEHIVQIKEIVAIKDLISNNILKHKMQKKLEECLNGYRDGSVPVTGLRFRLQKIFMASNIFYLNGEKQTIKSQLTREFNNLAEIMEEFKASVFDKCFNEDYDLHPNYPISISSRNIVDSFTRVAQDVTRGDFTSLSVNTRTVLNSLNLLNADNYPDVSQSKIVDRIIQILHENKPKVTDIEKEIVAEFADRPYGLEPELIHLILVLLTVQGKVVLKQRGGKQIDINNIKTEFKSLSAFETIAYVQLQVDYSYDFAERLLNTLGLNGAKIRTEKERLAAFREYKAKLSTILNKIENTHVLIEEIKQRPMIFLKIDQVEAYFRNILEIDWNRLDISNHTQFSSIEDYNRKLHEIKNNLEQLHLLNEALSDYQSDIHKAVEYMNQALTTLQENPFMVTDAQQHRKLEEFRNDVVSILAEFDKFIERSFRNPIAGKIQQFKKIYIYDFYFKVHENNVGKKADWDVLKKIQEQETYQKLVLLNQVTCIAATRFNQKIAEWDELKKHQCLQLDSATLSDYVICNKCLFPKPNVNYSEIRKAFDRIDGDLNAIYTQHEKTIVDNIRQYRENIEMLDFTPDEKKQINKILEQKKLPEKIDRSLIDTINQLFTKIDIVELDRDQLQNAFFHEGEMLTLDAFRKAFFDLEAKIKAGRSEKEIRIKLT